MNLLSKLFGKKKENKSPAKFFPENRLEALLMRASKDRIAQADFYRELLDTDLFVLVMPQENQSGRFVAEKGDTLSLVCLFHEERKLVPIFTSERRLREFIQEDQTQAKLNGRSLFTMMAAAGDEAILNPGASYGKELIRGEIQALVDGSIFQQHQQKVVKQDTKVLIGMPKEYPEKVVKALCEHFKMFPNVSKAYVAQIHMPDSEEPPHLIFSIKANDMKTLVPSMGPVLEKNLGVNEFADIIQFGQGSLDDYFETQEPFYKREK